MQDLELWDDVRNRANDATDWSIASYITADGLHVYGYDARNRMTSVDGSAARYQLNGQGQRVGKTVGSVASYAAYDEQGKVIGEYDGSAAVQETVYLGSTPVAVLKGAATYYNAPRIVRSAADAVVWRWDADAFGTVSANEDPGSTGTPFVYSLRFPGQMFDKESGLHYNYFRDYNPSIGRYSQSDPIGLAGGVNTYSYVGGNPLSRSDPSGLKCVAGVGCWTTPDEMSLLNSGNYLGYYSNACANGDAYACFAGHIAVNDNLMGQFATNRLTDALRDMANRTNQCINESDILNKIRADLANAYARMLPDSQVNARWPNDLAVAKFHWDEFAKFGLPPSTFGGTPFGTAIGPFWPSITGWCPNCTSSPRATKP